MKKIILILVVIISVIKTYSQQQMRFWSLPGRYMEFNSSGPLSLTPLAQGTCSPYVNTATYTNCHNIMYDNNGKILFFIVDGNVYSGTGDLIGSLTDDVNNLDKFKGVDDYAIGKDPTCDGRYYIFFAGEGIVGGYINSLPYYAHLDLNLTNAGSGTTSNCQGIGKLKDVGGATAFAMPNAGGAFSEHAASVQFAISKPINSSNERFVFVKSTLGFSRFKITNGNGVVYDNYTRMFPYPANGGVQGSSQARGETELVSIGSGYRLACTYILLDVNNPTNAGNKIFISDLDASGTETSSRIVSLYTSPSDPLMPTGLEFSANGDNLYFTHTTYAANTNTTFAINYYTYSANTPTSNILNNLPGVSLAVADLYSASQIELGYDGKLYFVKGDGMASFSSPDMPASGTWNPNAFSFAASGFTYAKSTVGLPASSIKHIYILPDQIDGEIYNDHVFDAINYTALVQTTTWTNTSNPWGHPSPIKVSGALTIPSGANITIQDMTFEFAVGASIQIKNLATLKIEGSTLRALSCGVMWDGVDILNGGKLYMGKYGSPLNNTSKIYDALEAINLTGNSAFLEVIDQSLFNKNAKHIVINNGNGNLIKIQNNLLWHSISLRDPNVGVVDPNGTLKYGYSSIEIRGSGLGINNQIIIGNPTPNSTDVNDMRRGEKGIIVENSNVDIIHNNFSDIFQTGLEVDQLGNANRTVKVTNFNTFDAQTNSPNNPNYMVYGIYAKNGSNMTILWNYFNHFQYGSTEVYLMNNNNRNLYVNYNNFNNNNLASWHIKSYNNGGASSVLQVEGNLIVGSGQSVAVDVTESALSVSNTFAGISILNNNVSGVGLGINLLNIRGFGHTATVNSPGYNANSLIFGNNISFVSSITAGRTGIRTKNSPKMSIAENTILSDNPGDWQNNGISVENSETTLVYKNHISAGTGLLAMGNMVYSNYYCNTFDGYVSGIKLFSHILRPNSGITHGDATFGRQNIFSNQASWGYTVELINCNNLQNKWAAFRHPLSGIPNPFTITNNGVPNVPSLIEFTNSAVVATGCKDAQGGPTPSINEDSEVDGNLINNSILVFPNPNNGEFTLSIQSSLNANPNMYVMDVSGRIIDAQTISIQDGLTQIPITKTELPAGIYFIKVDGFDEPIKMIVSK